MLQGTLQGTRTAADTPHDCAARLRIVALNSSDGRMTTCRLENCNLNAACPKRAICPQLIVYVSITPLAWAVLYWRWTGRWPLEGPADGSWRAGR